jgi:hypothetical protein
MCFFTQFSFAQKAKSVIKKSKPVAKSAGYKTTASDSVFVEKIATEMSICIQPLIDSLHPVILEYVQNVGKFGDKIAKTKLDATIKKLSPEELEKVSKSGALMDGLDDKNNSMNVCLNDIESKFKETDDIKPGSSKEKAYDKLLLYYLKKTKGGELFAMFLESSKK